MFNNGTFVSALVCVCVCMYVCISVHVLPLISGGLWACQKLQLLMADGNLVINSAVSEYCVEKITCLVYSLLPFLLLLLLILLLLLLLLILASQGLECLHCLQHLSLAENHLPKLMGVVNCPLLQYVNTRQNDLQQVRPMYYCYYYMLHV